MIEVLRREGEDMYNHSISSLLSMALLSLTAALAPVWAQTPSNLPPAENSGLEKTLTGTVSDAVCKGWHNRKGQTYYSSSLKCVEDGADYVLVVGKTLAKRARTKSGKRPADFRTRRRARAGARTRNKGREVWENIDQA